MFRGDKRRNGPRAMCAPRQAHALIHLVLAAALVIGIAVAGTAVSVGLARAQSATGLPDPDASLVIGMLAAAVTVMSILSALAVRFIGRPRQR
ncbi:MAG TPA: hypothetical protein VFQ27_06415 [Xanthobacteraceae bacterium]|nr:hypothetical protein [Xanthobacteraceae bacterium]